MMNKINNIKFKNPSVKIINNVKGINRVVWDLGYDGSNALEDKIKEGVNYDGIRPKVIPGKYYANIDYNGQNFSKEISVIGDTRINMSVSDYKSKLDALLELRLSLIHI